MNATTRKLSGQPINVEYRELGGPTAERLMKSGGDFEVGDDKRGTRVYRFQDEPLERAFARRAIHPSEYTALQRFKHHWYHADLAPHIGSVDLNRIFAPDFGSMVGMARSERQAHHRHQYREACRVIAEHPDGHRIKIVVDSVVCSENSLEVAGFAIGYSSPFRARAGAVKRLCSAGDILSRFWSIC
jgi:hypothetical protein